MSFDKKQLLLYAVTDRTWLGELSLLQQVEESLKGGVTMIQLREKHLDRARFHAEALDLKQLCLQYSVPLILNDDVELALEIDADGVHVGQEDMTAGQVHAKLGPDKLLGVSVHTVAEALEAQAAGADYLGVGAIFPTGTKTDVSILPYDRLKAICSCVTIPAVAIGGISAGNIRQLMGSGISGVAVVSAVYAQPDILSAAQTLRALAEDLVTQ